MDNLKVKRRIILVILIVVVAAFVWVIVKNAQNKTYSDITITRYDVEILKKIETINITSDEDREKIDNFVKELKPLDENEYVALAFRKEIEINYKDDLKIVIQLDQEDYCHYTDNEGTEHIGKMPERFAWMGKRKN